MTDTCYYAEVHYRSLLIQICELSGSNIVNLYPRDVNVTVLTLTIYILEMNELRSKNMLDHTAETKWKGDGKTSEVCDFGIKSTLFRKILQSP